jgi:RNA-directed DNA polymerase
VTILNAVYEPIFSGFSYGSRPGRHSMMRLMHCTRDLRRKINWILDCDIEGFFDNLSHDHLLSFLEERVSDKRMLRLIRKWLRVGWVEDGKRHAGTIGTPQGSVISPLLANIFLNTVMDKWASQVAKCRGKRGCHHRAIR